MVKLKFERIKPHVNVGAIGHVDHGKATLTAAITKFFGNYRAYDKIHFASEEGARAVAIATAHVEYETKLRRYEHVDARGMRPVLRTW